MRFRGIAGSPKSTVTIATFESETAAAETRGVLTPRETRAFEMVIRDDIPADPEIDLNALKILDAYRNGIPFSLDRYLGGVTVLHRLDTGQKIPPPEAALSTEPPYPVSL